MSHRGWEAVKLLNPTLVASEPEIAWVSAAGMRDWPAHHYFDQSERVRETLTVRIAKQRST